MNPSLQYAEYVVSLIFTNGVPYGLFRKPQSAIENRWINICWKNQDLIRISSATSITFTWEMPSLTCNNVWQRNLDFSFAIFSLLINTHRKSTVIKHHLTTEYRFYVNHTDFRRKDIFLWNFHSIFYQIRFFNVFWIGCCILYNTYWTVFLFMYDDFTFINKWLAFTT